MAEKLEFIPPVLVPNTEAQSSFLHCPHCGAQNSRFYGFRYDSEEEQEFIMRFLCENGHKYEFRVKFRHVARPVLVRCKLVPE